MSGGEGSTRITGLSVGFSGTRTGMTAVQASVVYEVMKSVGDVLHHGDCVGADAEAHRIAAELGLPIVVHPPLDRRLRAFCRGGEVRRPKLYRSRNNDILKESSLLVTAPLGMAENGSGGTWPMMQKAREIGLPVVIAWPDGTTDTERLTGKLGAALNQVVPASAPARTR